MVDVEESDNSEQAQLVTVHGRLGSVTFKPYRDIKTRTVTTVGEQADTASCLTVDSLYPEILCHVFSYLDTSSKGRAAQVTMNKSHQLSLSLSEGLSKQSNISCLRANCFISCCPRSAPAGGMSSTRRRSGEAARPDST